MKATVDALETPEFILMSYSQLSANPGLYISQAKTWKILSIGDDTVILIRGDGGVERYLKSNSPYLVKKVSGTVTIEC